MKLRKSFASRDGVSYKYIQETGDHHFIETGAFDIGEAAVCISTQIGCPLGCVFCASTKPVDSNNPELKYIRNLTADEIVSQVENVIAHTKLDKDMMLSYMGIGEPFLNYEAVLESIRRLAKHEGIKRATIATSGVRPELIRKLAKEEFSIPVKIQLSLHAPSQTLRKSIMPGSKSLKDAIEATYYFAKETKQNIKVNYVLIKGINDRKEDALKLAKLLTNKRDWLSVKLMRLQPIGDLVEAQESSFKLFEDILDSNKVRHDRYVTDGRDIQSNCGQLRRYYFGDDSKALAELDLV
jgi:23S rRNA (adenine2503-C2)-methyltransferase